uniref:Ovule protein n=1 Tax=Panagrellus redivivus TaxID=6233 RepID=A0A7E4ZV92_PANRE
MQQSVQKKRSIDDVRLDFLWKKKTAARVTSAVQKQRQTRGGSVFSLKSLTDFFSANFTDSLSVNCKLSLAFDIASGTVDQVCKQQRGKPRLSPNRVKSVWSVIIDQ